METEARIEQEEVGAEAQASGGLGRGGSGPWAGEGKARTPISWAS